MKAWSFLRRIRDAVLRDVDRQKVTRDRAEAVLNGIEGLEPEVHARILNEYPASVQRMVIGHLLRYGVKPEQQDVTSIRLAVLDVAKGDPHVVARQIVHATVDPRDVLTRAGIFTKHPRKRAGHHGIDPLTGNIVAIEGTITPSVTKTDFVTSPLFESGDWANKDKGFYLATIVPLHIDNITFNGMIMFWDEAIYYVQLVIDDPTLASRLNDWLSNTVGASNANFSWGKVDADFDSQSGYASVTVRYSAK